MPKPNVQTPPQKTIPHFIVGYSRRTGEAFVENTRANSCYYFSPIEARGIARALLAAAAHAASIVPKPEKEYIEVVISGEDE